MRHFASKVIVVSCFLMIGLVINALFGNSVVYASSAGLLKEGMKGDAVVRLQMLLHENGFYEDTIDGYYGPSTQQAVLRFQFAYDLLPDGIAGPETVQVLRETDLQVSRGKVTNSRIGKEIVAFAQRFLHTPYVWGGTQSAGFDCSGYIYYIFKQHGIELPRMADEQFLVGMPVQKNQLQEGDLVYFSTYEPGPSHVGIYIGSNRFIHASSAAGMVTVTPLDKAYYVERYLGARRVQR